MSLKYINQPLNIGAHQLKNRFVMPPMLTNFATPDGLMTDRQIAYYTARAAGGVGLIIVEITAVSTEGRGFIRGLGLYDDSQIPPLAKITRIAHSYSAKILIQLAHAGRQTQIPSPPPLAPSPCPLFGIIPRELTPEEIKIIQRRFSEAALRAYKAGFDGIEIHGAHGYLIHQFLSPRTNQRSDAYGQGFEGRTRFLIEVLDEIKQKVPSDFLIGCRLNGEDYLEGGLNIEDAKRIAIMLAALGISYLHISGSTDESGHMGIAPMDMAPGYMVPSAAEIKKVVLVPVITVGRIVDPIQADTFIGAGRADLVAMGRALFADPDLPRKALEGRFDEIRPCIGCNQGCRKPSERCCTMNPETLREQEFTLSAAARSKRVLVVGGGPAGLECARVAKLRGHEVVLIEKAPQCGGNFSLASIPPKRSDIKKGLQFFEREIERLGIEVKWGETATPESIERYRPDEVVIATGAIPSRPPLPGIDQDNVFAAEEVLLGKRTAGNRVLIIGGGLVGSEVADFVSAQGKKVVLVEMLSDIALDMEPSSSIFLRQRLQKQGVDTWLSWKARKICGDRVTLEKEGEEKTIGPFDSIIFAVGYQPLADLSARIKSTAFKIHVIGDAVKPRDALTAIFEGSKAAREI